jgi:hypothetical protein
MTTTSSSRSSTAASATPTSTWSTTAGARASIRSCRATRSPAWSPPSAPSVTKFKEGDRVGVGCFVDSCTTCAARDLDREQYMPGLVLTYSSFAARQRPADLWRLFRPHGGQGRLRPVDPRQPGPRRRRPLLCAGITLYSPLRHWNAGPGKSVAILGLGGLGHMGVKLAHAMGAEVTVLSQTLSKQADGLKMGADHYYATSDAATFETLAGTFDLIICTVSAGDRLGRLPEPAEGRRDHGAGRRAGRARAAERLRPDPRPPHPGRLDDRLDQGNPGDARLLRPARHRRRHRDHLDRPDQRRLRLRAWPRATCATAS